MITTTSLSPVILYSPLRNTPPVSLAQDLPSDLDADILLLGCGDCRNILFTCYADQRRKFDVTCCDVEPTIHARNVLLYTLLIDDKENSNVNQIWNIYFHWKIDKSSLELLETQVQKLLLLSESIDKWHSSVYGSSIRFCTDSSLASVRLSWQGFTSQGLSPYQKNQRQEQMQDAIRKAKLKRTNTAGVKNPMDLAGFKSTYPSFNFEAVIKIADFNNEWWEHGTTIPFDHASATKPTDLNPAFLFFSDQRLILHHTTSPIHGFPLSDVCALMSKESAFVVQNKNTPLAHHLIDCVLNHFKLWASAFRKAVEKESAIVRIFAGHAFNFCLTLRNCSESTSTNMFCHNITNIPLVLHHNDYGFNVRTAPLRFDVIRASNLIQLGALNLLTAGASLLKQHAFSCLILKFIIEYDPKVADPLFDIFGVDIRTLSLVLGLVPPDLFTNTAIGAEAGLMLGSFLRKRGSNAADKSVLSVRWRRIRSETPKDTPLLDVSAEALSKFVIEVHNVMFWYEDNLQLAFDSLSLSQKVNWLSYRPYNRASFAFFLSVVKANVICDWSRCLEIVHNAVVSANDHYETLRGKSNEDFILNMHVFGLDSSQFRRPTPEDTNSAVLRAVLPAEDLPDLLCVTLRVPRKCFKFLTEANTNDIPSYPGIFCTLQCDLRDPIVFSHFFSSVQVAFGKWCGDTKDGVSCPYIEEDLTQLAGTSDMFVSVTIPTSLLLVPKVYVPTIICGFLLSSLNRKLLSKFLGPPVIITHSEVTSNDVFITRSMPRMSALPLLTAPSSRQDEPIDTTSLRFTDNGLKIKSLMKRVFLSTDQVCQNLKSSSLKLRFESPFTALARTNHSSEVKLTFPAPVSISKSRYNFCDTTSDHKLHFEVISNFFDPLEDEAGFFFLPTFLTKTSRNSTIPLPWTSSNLDLDVLPQVLRKDVQALRSWLPELLEKMFSDRENRIHKSKTRDDIRTELKWVIFPVYLDYMGLSSMPADFFVLSKKAGDIQDIQTLIFPSCLRLDLANSSVVLDCALIPVTDAVRSDPKVFRLQQELFRDTAYLTVSDAENRAWKAMMPALAERCRTWSHTADCEYAQVGEVPLPKGLCEDGKSPICSCGIGKFPKNYLEDQIKRSPTLKTILNKYATRVAISPIFAFPCVEDSQGFKRNRSMIKTEILEKCENCRSNKRINGPTGQESLLVCSRCKLAKYCSVNCQRIDWKRHKPLCSR